ncbi:hypothetical protein K474DRAFT_1706024 [Panus rudis PR-1116 ss-1]|nr:hypothetical protein K474DRAFT_1706024 [Panus rudis PR-1116 ss-1]
MSSPTAESLLGSALIITVLSFGLYGITVVQTFSYVCNVQDDTKLLKWLVVFIILLETLLSAFELHVIYFFTVSAWGDLTSVNTIPWTVPVCPWQRILVLNLSLTNHKGCVVVTNFIVILVQGSVVGSSSSFLPRSPTILATDFTSVACGIVISGRNVYLISTAGFALTARIILPWGKAMLLVALDKMNGCLQPLVVSVVIQ